MRKFIIILITFLFGCFSMYYFLSKSKQKNEHQQAQIIVSQIRSLKNLIVTEGVFSETYSYQNSKNYFYNFFQFEKRALLIVNAKVQVSYNLGLLETKIDTVNKTITIKKIPEPSVEIIPDIRYFDMQQSAFNTFSNQDLNQLQKEAIKRIETTSETVKLKERAKKDLIRQLKSIYLLSNAMDWKLIDETSFQLEKQFKD